MVADIWTLRRKTNDTRGVLQQARAVDRVARKVFSSTGGAATKKQIVQDVKNLCADLGQMEPVQRLVMAQTLFDLAVSRERFPIPLLVAFAGLRPQLLGSAHFSDVEDVYLDHRSLYLAGFLLNDSKNERDSDLAPMDFWRSRVATFALKNIIHEVLVLEENGPGWMQQSAESLMLTEPELDAALSAYETGVRLIEKQKLSGKDVGSDVNPSYSEGKVA